MASVFSQAEPYRLTVGGQIRGIQDQIRGREVFTATPKSLVVNSVNPRAAFPNLIGTQKLIEFVVYFFRGEGERTVRSLRIALEALPMAFECKRNSADDACGCEQAPTVQQTRLSGRKAYIFDGQEPVIMENETVDQHVPPKDQAILSHNGFVAIDSPFGGAGETESKFDQPFFPVLRY